jgi:hypothetical protein
MLLDKLDIKKNLFIKENSKWLKAFLMDFNQKKNLISI